MDPYNPKPGRLYEEVHGRAKQFPISYVFQRIEKLTPSVAYAEKFKPYLRVKFYPGTSLRWGLTCLVGGHFYHTDAPFPYEGIPDESLHVLIIDHIEKLRAQISVMYNLGGINNDIYWLKPEYQLAPRK